MNAEVVAAAMAPMVIESCMVANGCVNRRIDKKYNCEHCNLRRRGKRLLIFCLVKAEGSGKEKKDVSFSCSCGRKYVSYCWCVLLLLVRSPFVGAFSFDHVGHVLAYLLDKNGVLVETT